MTPPSGLGSYLARARGTLTVLRALPAQRRIPYLDPERVAALRDRRVAEIVRFAAARVPFYRELFARERLDPREFRSADDLARLPFLDRNAIATQPSRFRAEGVVPAVRLRTSGSTGRPIDVWYDRESLLRNIAWSERQRVPEVVLVGRRRGYTILHLSRAGSTMGQVLGYYDAAAFRPLRPRRSELPLETPFEEVVTAIERARPAVFAGYGGYLEALFRTLHARGVRPRHRPALVIYAAEGMSAHGRRLIEDEFGIPVLSRYNAVESLQIGFMCEQRDGFHLNEDLCHLRVVTADGTAAAAGERGEIVVSNLVNRATVLLNYRLGDLGRLGTRACTCGRTTPILAELAGRVAEIVRLPDRTLVHEHAVGDIVLRAEGIIRSRLVQTEPARFELRLETLDEAAFQTAAEATVPPLRDLLRGTEVEAVRVPDLAPRSGEKAKSIVLLDQRQSRAGNLRPLSAETRTR